MIKVKLECSLCPMTVEERFSTFSDAEGSIGEAMAANKWLYLTISTNISDFGAEAMVCNGCAAITGLRKVVENA